MRFRLFLISVVLVAPFTNLISSRRGIERHLRPRPSIVSSRVYLSVTSGA